MYMKKFSILLSLSLMLVMSALAQTTINLPDCNDCTVVSTLNCALATFDNTEFVSGEEFRATMHLPYTGGNGQPAGDLSVPSTGVTGLTADLVGMNLVLGDGSLMFYVYGIPSGPGTASFDITFGGQSCTVDVTLTEVMAIAGSSNGFELGEVCPLMMDIKDWSRHADINGVTAETEVFITSKGELWGFGNNNANRELGYAANSTDPATLDDPRLGEVYTPSPVAAIYRQGLDKTWVSVVGSDLEHGYWAINTENELWAWGGADGDYDREAHGTIPVGQSPLDAWEIDPPAGISGFTQIYSGHYNVAWARGTDGKLYSWGSGARTSGLGHTPYTGTSAGALVNISVPTRAVQIPHDILDNKYAVLPSANLHGCIYIAEDGNTYNYGADNHVASAFNPTPQLISLPAGVKAVKLTSTYTLGSGSQFPICLGDNGKLYFIQGYPSTSFPDANVRTQLNITPTTQPVHTWVEFDPEGAGGTYRDVAAGDNQDANGLAVTDDGNVFHFDFGYTTGTTVFDVNTTALDIVEVYAAGSAIFAMKGADGRSFVYAPNERPGNEVGSGGNIQNKNGYPVGANPMDPTPGPYLMNCYVNPGDINGATPPGPAPGDPEVTTLDCASATFNNTEFTTGEEFVASMMLPYTGGNGGTIPELSINSTGVTGLTADVVAGDIASGAGTLIFYVHGTPSGAGMASFAVSFGGETCTANLTLTEAVAASAGFTIGEVCPLMLDIQEWGFGVKEQFSGNGSWSELYFITSTGELWGYGNNQNSRGMGYPNLLTDRPDASAEIPIMENITAPSPVAAIYRQGLNKTWKSARRVSKGGPFALATDGTLWTWGGDESTAGHAWDRAVKGGGIGTEPWTAWEIPPPSGLTFTQIYHEDENSIYARGSDGRLYSWGEDRPTILGQSSGTTPVEITTPTLADLIPQTIKDDKYAVHPSTTGSAGLVYIDENGDTWFYRNTNSLTYTPIPLILPAGVKAVKLTGGLGISNIVFCLGDDGKIYFIPLQLPNPFNYGSGLGALVPAGVTYPPATHSWVEIDPEGAGGTYRDIVASGSIISYAITDDGNTIAFRMNGTTLDLETTSLDIETGEVSIDNVLILKGTDGRSFMRMSSGSTSMDGAGTWTNETPYATGIEPGDIFREGPYLLNCYVNPTGINNATGN